MIHNEPSHANKVLSVSHLMHSIWCTIQQGRARHDGTWRTHERQPFTTQHCVRLCGVRRC